MAFAKVERDCHLTFEGMEGGQQASFPLEDLSDADRAQLGRLIARLRPDDPEAQALAGILMELSSHTEPADQYFEKTPEKLKDKLYDIFG